MVMGRVREATALSVRKTWPSYGRYYREHRDQVLEQARVQRKQASTVRAQAFIHLGGAFCVDCDNSDERVLEFDHIPERGVKHRNISLLVGKGCWTRQLESELKKCEVVCANCHAIRTGMRRKS